jgi:hypothetical protein
MDKINIKYESFPNPQAPDEEKAGKDYGLKWARAIQYEWFNKSEGGTASFYGRAERFDNLRKYAAGEHDTSIHKDLITQGSDKSYTNYDWRPIQVAPKFVNLLVNQMTERLFKIKAVATDPFSTDLRNKKREMMENFMVSKDMLEKAKAIHGVDLMPEGEMPETQEEIDLHMNLQFKPSIEIAVETAVRYTLDINDYEQAQTEMLEDVSVVGVGVAERYTDPVKGIVVNRVPPEEMVYSNPTSKDLKESFYYGRVQLITISEFVRLSGLDLTEDDVAHLKGAAKQWHRHHGYSMTGLESEMVPVMHFTFKAVNSPTYKKKYNKSGGYSMIKKESTFDKPDAAYKGYDVVKKRKEVWYEGSYVLGTDILFNYGIAMNMVRPKGHLNYTLPKYSMYIPEMYKGKPKSLIERIVPNIDQMQQIHVKIQQMIAKARPSGVYIDVDGLSEIALGDGNFLTPLEQIKIYDDTGNVLGSSAQADGSYNHGKESIRELKNGVIDGLDRLIGAWNHELTGLRDAIGIPQGMDASMPHPDTLVGVQEQVAVNSNIATRHILQAVLHITKRVAIGTSLGLQDIFKYSNLKEAYVSAIGKINMEILDVLNDIHLYDVGINIDLKPDKEERQYLEGNISMALQRQEITLDDAIDVRRIENTDLANELLKIRRKKREKEKREHEEKMIKVSAEENGKAAERASQAKAQELEIEEKKELAIIEAQKQSKMAVLDKEGQVKAGLMEKEFEYNMTLKGVDVDGKLKQTSLAESERTNRERVKGQNNAGSKGPSAPPTFESSEDNLTGNVELGEMEPS